MTNLLICLKYFEYLKIDKNFLRCGRLLFIQGFRKMENENLYKFLTSKCKKRRLPIESLPEFFGFSRSSLYRYMKGVAHMPPEVQSKFVQVLKLDEAEQQEFERFVALSQVDDATIAARKALDNFVFGKPGDQEPLAPVDFAYIDGDTFLRTSDEIYALIHALAVQPESSCRVRIINCLDKRFLIPLTSFLETLFSEAKNITVEHLINFSDKDSLHNINAFLGILPLLKYHRYSVYCNELATSENAKKIFDDAIIVEICIKDIISKQFFISFLQNDLSTCLATSDKNISVFIAKNYESLKKYYSIAILDYSSIDVFSEKLVEFEECAPYFVLKPNFCYHRIPVSVYHDIISRIPEQELAAAQKGLMESGGSLESGLASLTRRIAASYKNPQLDVYSKNGLIEFARTGRITDYFVFFPSLNNEERRAVFEYIRDRNNNIDDPYRLFITNENILDNGYVIVVFEGVGVLIEYEKSNYTTGAHTNLFVKNKIIADIMSDYMKMHIPGGHALEKDECDLFLNTLIAGLH